MANTTRNFTQGKMNKMVDERLVPDGQYVDALNIRMGSTEGSEIGVIENIKDLKKSGREIVVDQLEKAYYMPRIERINSIDGRFGVTQWQVDTNFGPSQINLGSRLNVTPMDSSRVLIKDVDGNRYEIVNYNELDPKSHALLELYL